MESTASDDERELYSWPIRGRSLGIPMLQKCASIHYETSKARTACLVDDESRGRTTSCCDGD